MAARLDSKQAMKGTEIMKTVIAIFFIALDMAAASLAPPPPVTIVESRPYLAPVTVDSLVVTPPLPPTNEAWEGTEEVTSDRWTEFTLAVGTTGAHLYLGVDGAAAQISVAEVVFDNGDSQVIDCNDQVVPPGLYSLIDLTSARKIDHIRVVARADTAASDITLRLAV
jgi:hypothetical protein